MGALSMHSARSLFFFHAAFSSDGTPFPWILAILKRNIIIIPATDKSHQCLITIISSPLVERKGYANPPTHKSHKVITHSSCFALVIHPWPYSAGRNGSREKAQRSQCHFSTEKPKCVTCLGSSHKFGANYNKIATRTFLPNIFQNAFSSTK
jgi:hypothetical protein